MANAEMDDLAAMTSLTEIDLNNALRARYIAKKIYTYVGDILVAVNPYEDLGIYGEDETKQYRQVQGQILPPHIFAIADKAYTAAMQTTKSQVCVISGESGAGKTESTKLIIAHVLHLCSGSVESLHTKILQVNPLLEAFGNAQTVMNHNSSRFGKYIELAFNQHGSVSGALMSDYLLERSRVVTQGQGERNFHIFYYLIDGLDPSLKQSFHLRSPEDFYYISSKDLTIPPNVCKQRWQEIQQALQIVGFSGWRRDDLVALLAAILHLGNIALEEEDSTETAYIADPRTVDMAASILNVDAKRLSDSLLLKSSTVRGETIIKKYRQFQAENARDAAAKAVYGQMFSWLVEQINDLLAPQQKSLGQPLSIGILDIFGFENFDVNSFEQICINLANEQLQFFFNEHIFRMELEEYKKEGISSTGITFVDNKPLLDLFTRKPIGMLSLLDEESKLASGKDSALMRKYETNFKSQHLAVRGRGFIIEHYAGRVEYSSYGLVEKNRDLVPDLVTTCFEGSRCKLMQVLFNDGKAPSEGAGLKVGGGGGGGIRKSMRGISFRRSKRGKSMKSAGPAGPLRGRGGGGKGGAKKKMTVSARFTKSLELLMSKMNPCDPHFVRCLKPNPYASPECYEAEFVMTQLRYTGMMETVRVRKEGYAYRPTFEEFINRFGSLCFSHNAKIKMTAASCHKILKSLDISQYETGKTKMFLKYWHMDQLSSLVTHRRQAAITLQKVIRGRVDRVRYFRQLAKLNLEQQAGRKFFEDMFSTATHIFNTLMQLGEEDERRLKQAEDPSAEPVLEKEVAPDGHVPAHHEVDEKLASVLFPKQKLAEPGTRQHRKTMKNRRAEVVKWFKTTQIPAGVVDALPDSDDEDDDNLLKKMKNAQELEAAKWFHGIISRSEAEKLLYGKPTGTFLIRVSESRCGYSVSLVHAGRFRHYKIQTTEDLGFILVGTGRKLDSLHDLVKYYKKHPLSIHNDLLKHPLGQKVASEDDPDAQPDYAELLWDKEKMKSVLKENNKRTKTPEPSVPRDFVKAMAPILEADSNAAIDSTTIIEMQQAFGTRQKSTGAPYGRSSFLEEQEAKSKPRVTPHTPKAPISKIVPVRDIMADAERRIALAHQDWEAADKKKKKGFFGKRKGAKKNKKKKKKKRDKFGQKVHPEAFDVTIQEYPAIIPGTPDDYAYQSSTPQNHRNEPEELVPGDILYTELEYPMATHRKVPEEEETQIVYAKLEYPEATR